MLSIDIKAGELWDNEKEEFIQIKDYTLCLEHSLVSLAKWESKWHIPFLSNHTKTFEEMIDYIKCMTISKNVDPHIYMFLTEKDFVEIDSYIQNPMTATWFSDNGVKQARNHEQVTAEIIYYWMISMNIPFECRKWHLNQLLTLIRVCSVKNTQPKKMSKREIQAQNAALNASRLARRNSKR